MTPIYHITHIDNLPTIVAEGLVCDSSATAQGLTRVAIGYTQIKTRRALREVNTGPGGNLNDYVPFYFGPRSPMLFTISQGNVPQYQQGQERILHLVVDARKVEAAGLDFVYTDGHAVMEISDFFTDLTQVASHVDFTLMKARYWNDTPDHPDRMRRRQAEFLIFRTVAWGLVEAIGVMNEAIREEVLVLIEEADHQPPVIVRPGWYY